MRRHKVALLLAANVVLLAAFGLCVEAALRLTVDPRYAPRAAFEVADARTVWANAPNLDGTYYGADFAMHIVTDASGNRLSPLGPPRDTDDLVVLVGDSYTFGWGVSTGETLAADLDRRLAEIRPGWRVVNLGVPGFGTLAVAERLRAFLARTDPRRVQAVVVLHADNDAVDNVEFLLYQAGVKVRRFPRSLQSQFRLVNLASTAWRRLEAPSEATPRAPARLEWNGADFGALADVDLVRETDLPATKASPHLTTLQLTLMRLGIDRINGACAGCNLAIHHVILNLADHRDAYAASVGQAFISLEAHGNRVSFHGQADLGGHDDRVPAHNAHSGGHFTPAFNRGYAGLLLRLLQG